MYKQWDITVFLSFLSDEELDTVHKLMKKGENGTITQEEIDIVDRLLEKNESHIQAPPKEEFDRMVQEAEKDFFEKHKVE